ncbi:hypothetical protein [Rhodanobacter sp. C05]|uniref:hypothetical protein n=1 Tax=Rhodanobacter sp. C05 TaxID=1945855 RepID=UPI0009847DE2|nr:hypothetical protein [Rhodanobacter sp. C05]OOG40646.1 hypothetical protein B0E51_08355 [Rhodanobacter sp. C05]
MASNDAKFLAAVVSSGGVITWPVALVLGGHFGLSQATVQRVLQRLVEAGAMHRTTIVGERSNAWLTTPATASAYERPAATRFLGRGNPGATWSPGPTLRHDQLALIATFGFTRAADDEEEATASPEAEIETQYTSTAGLHVPDGAFVLHPGGQMEICVGVEVELSKKSGGATGKNSTAWARSLAPSILDRQAGAGTRILALDRAIGATLLVAPRRLAVLIRNAVWREAEERGCDPGWIFWAEPEPGRLELGQMKIWHLEFAEPPED